MPLAKRNDELIRLLVEGAPAEIFIAALRGYPTSIHTTDPADHDVALLIQFYADLTRSEKNITYFSRVIAPLAKVCVEQNVDRTRFLHVLRQMFGADPQPTSEALSCFLMFSIIAGEHRDLVRLFRVAIDQAKAARVIDAPLMMAIRSFLTTVNWLNIQIPNILVPPAEVRNTLRKNDPQRSAWEIAKAIEELIHRQVLATRSRPRQLHILFAMEDLCLERLNTVTKLYCDYFYVLLRHTSARISVRVFRITGGYDHARMPSVWDPPGGHLKNMMEIYFGDEGKTLAERINFAYVDCWHPTEDYVGTIIREIDYLQPDLCATLLDRFFSFLEPVVFELAPLLQIEIIHDSVFVRQCDALIPNGVPSERRQKQFICVDAPLPQIPFPILKPLTKRDLGFDSEHYVVCVVGKNFPRRLDGEGKRALSAAFSNTLADLLDRHAAVSLLLVGEDPRQIDEWFARSGARPDMRRVIVIEFTEELRATMQACDLIVCPPVAGGGRGMALAISDRLPVLIFDDNDSGNFVPDTQVCHDFDAFINKVEQYIGLGPGYRETYLSASGVAPFSDAYNRDCALKFLDAAWAASLRGRARLNAAVANSTIETSGSDSR